MDRAANAADGRVTSKPILSDLAWRILRRLKDGSMTSTQLAEEFAANADAIQELLEVGFIKQSPVKH